MAGGSMIRRTGESQTRKGDFRMNKNEVELLKARLDLYEAELELLKENFSGMAEALKEYLDTELQTSQAQRSNTEAQQNVNAVNTKALQESVADKLVLVNVIARLGYLVIQNTEANAQDLLSIVNEIEGDLPTELREAAGFSIGTLQKLWDGLAAWEATQ